MSNKLMAPNYVPKTRPQQPSKVAARARAVEIVEALLPDGSNKAMAIPDIVRTIRNDPVCTVLDHTDCLAVIRNLMNAWHPNGQPPEYMD